MLTVKSQQCGLLVEIILKELNVSVCVNYTFYY